jgi:uncharacterized membrane protein YdfJ with MMPL/SSD domain
MSEYKITRQDRILAWVFAIVTIVLAMVFGPLLHPR